jgi:hypothetical protein
MSELEFKPVDGKSKVYRPLGSIHSPAFTQKAKSTFADEHDVAFGDCRAKKVTYLGDTFVIVGEINDSTD